MRRFLILGNEGGSYYATERQLTLENAFAVMRCIKNDPQRAIELIKEVSLKGKAPKQEPVLFALAIMAGCEIEEARKLALNALPEIARTGSHLFMFLDMVTKLRGWGRMLKRSIGNWYISKPLDNLAYQMMKYQSRYGWTHRDAIKLSHPKPPTEEYAKLFRYIVKDELGDQLPQLIYDVIQSIDYLGNDPHGVAGVSRGLESLASQPPIYSLIKKSRKDDGKQSFIPRGRRGQIRGKQDYESRAPQEGPDPSFERIKCFTHLQQRIRISRKANVGAHPSNCRCPGRRILFDIRKRRIHRPSLAPRLGYFQLNDLGARVGDAWVNAAGCVSSNGHGDPGQGARYHRSWIFAQTQKIEDIPAAAA